MPLFIKLQSFKLGVFITFLLIILSYSCSKEEEDDEDGFIMVTGYVRDAISGKAISNADVFLVEDKRGSWSSWTRSGNDYQKSDENGQFNFKLKPDEDFVYSVLARHEFYYDGETYLSDYKKKQELVVKPDPRAWFAVRLIKESSQPWTEISLAYHHYALNNLPPDTIVYTEAPIRAPYNIFSYGIRNNDGQQYY
ncbi:MAG: hypothetical protein ACXWEY_04850, partial [Bacteroidia bacterium]